MDVIKSNMGDPLEIGPWKQISVLGSGAFGVVTLWRHQETEENVAIKKCKFQTRTMISPRQKERWNKEVEFMKSCNHQNLIKFKSLPADFENVLQKYNPTKLPLMSMEYCTRGNLRRFLLSEPIRLCGLDESDVRWVVQDVSNGLNYLHSKNITHRDLKPENIVLQHCDTRSGKNLYKIIDLGYAKELEYTIQSQVGTLHYLAPEIFENKPYNHTVDFWSLGLVVFEIVCGVLPFLPEMSPFERFYKIKEKDVDDICIYMQSSGAIVTSKEIKKENFITSSLKQNLETWLKCVLQYDSQKRSFPKVGVLEYLQFIVDKKIVKVFSLHKLEFYSYEITERTRAGTLKGWISRDVKISLTDLIILTNNEDCVCLPDDDNLIFDSVHEKTVIFVIKKNALISEKLEFNLPKAIRHLFSSTEEAFLPNFLRNLYRQCLFFVHTEKLSVEMLQQATKSLLKYFNTIFDELISTKDSMCQAVSFLLGKISNHVAEKKTFCDLDISQNVEAKECLKHSKGLLDNCERSLNRVKEFSVQFEAMRRLKVEIFEANNLQDAIDACDIAGLFCKINSKNFLETRNGEPKISKRLAQAVSQTMKLKTKHISENKVIKNWFKDFCTVLSSADQLTSWAKEFRIHLEQLSNAFTELDEIYRTVLQEEIDRRASETQMESTMLLKDNEDLRSQFDTALSQSLLAHQSYVMQLDSLF